MWWAQPICGAQNIYTHGHIDHVMGMAAIDEAAARAGEPRPHVIAHAAVPARFARYRLTAGLNAAINRRQFRIPGLAWPTEYRFPDETYSDKHRAFLNHSLLRVRPACSTGIAVSQLIEEAHRHIALVRELAV